MNIPDLTLSPTTAVRLDSFLQAPTHALLLTGPVSAEISQVATALAMQLLHAESLASQAYYREVRPEKDTIAIEQIRELIGFFRLKVPGSADIKRVAIIQTADAMGIEAQNALLKVLEEPPRDSVLILTTSQPQALLVTIRSRTQTLRVSSTEQKPEAEALRLVKQVLGGTTYERLLLVDGFTKQKGLSLTFMQTLTKTASASLEAAASRGSASLARWQTVLQVSAVAEDALMHNGSAKLVLTELMLSL
ncbi:MAG TPA: hypothetical protein VMB52_01800 [Verrucomicrobiae bacterium]|nr:hypothetical protein [Verrucomicrobiae bacterium]